VTSLKLPIYLDNSATTPLDPRVVERMLPYLTQHFRNPVCKNLPEDNYPWRVHVNQRTGERRAER